MTPSFPNPELSKSTQSVQSLGAVIAERVDMSGEPKFLNLNDLRTASLTNDKGRIKKLMSDAVDQAQDSRQTMAYSAERSWRVIQSFIREGNERFAMNVLQNMPQEFVSGQQKRANETLSMAARGNMRSAASAMLQAGANPIYVDEQQRTAIMNFSLYGDAPLVKSMLDFAERAAPGGALKALSMADQEGWTSSMFAVTSDAPSPAKREVLNVMKNAGWTFNKPCGHEGFTEIHAASAMNDVAMIKHLVEACGANVNQPSRDHYTPAMVAGQLGAAKSIAELGRLAANLEATQPKTGMSAAHFAAAKGHDAVLQALGAFRIDMQSPCKAPGLETPSQLARQSGHKQTAKLINELDAPAPSLRLENAVERIREMFGNVASTTKNLSLRI